MKKLDLIRSSLFAALTLGVLSAPLVWAQEPGPVVTATPQVQETTEQPTAVPSATPTPEPTSLPMPSPTSSPTAPLPAPSLALMSVEPKTLPMDGGGTLSLYGTGFGSGSAVRLVGYGLLVTSHINSTALTAQVPAGVPAGVYDVELCDSTRSALLMRALTIVAPTPTPKPRSPAAPPPPGRPILTVRNYVLEPAQVRPGQEFVVTIEIYNNGSRAGENTMAVFPGDSFLPVGEPGHVMGQVHINHVAVVTQRMRAPSTISSGVHQLTVNLGANDWEGNHYDYPQQVPVEVIGGGGGTGTAPIGKPKIIIDDARTEPAVLGPGELFTLTLRLVNLGTRTALDVFANASSSEIALPAARGGTASVEQVGVGAVVTVTVPLLLGDVETGGRQVLPVTLEYGDAAGGAHSEQQNVGVDVDTGLSRSPQLVITAYGTTPDFVTPGDTFTLTMRIANVGGGEAQRLTLALGGEGGAHLEPFIPVKAGNVIFVPAVEAGSSSEITRQLVVDGSADPKAYNLPIALAYDDPRGNRQQDVQRLSLVVRRRAELQATFYREPEALTVGSSTSLSLEVINMGVSAVNVVHLSASSPQMKVEAEGTPFMGPVEIGGSAPLDLTVTPREGGPAELVISVVYRDDFNQLQPLTRTLAIEVTDGPTGSTGAATPGAPGGTGQEEAGDRFWHTIGRAIRGFLGFGS